MVRVDVPVFVPLPKVIVLELREQVMNTEVGGVQVRFTVPLKPFRASTVMVDVPC